MQTQVSQPQDLMLQQLGEMLYVERTLAEDILPQLRQEVADSELQRGIDAHLEQTREHARNIEKAFDLLGQPAEAQRSPALEGLKQAHDMVAPNIQADGLRDVFDAEAAAKTEHLEIAAYKGIITMAEQLGMNELRDLMRTNCRQEQETLQQLETMTQKLSGQFAQTG
jgi:ferritin-like metal-binding protein YciE